MRPQYRVLATGHRSRVGDRRLAGLLQAQTCLSADIHSCRLPHSLSQRFGGQENRLAYLSKRAHGLGARTLAERYGVDFSKVHWILQAKEVFPVHDPTARIEYVDDKKNMVERLIGGELDAIITDISDAK